MDLGGWVALVGLALGVAAQAVSIGNWRGRMEEQVRAAREDGKEERNQAQRALERVLAELQAIRKELHESTTRGFEQFLRRDSFENVMARVDARFQEAWDAIDGLRENKISRAECQKCQVHPHLMPAVAVRAAEVVEHG